MNNNNHIKIGGINMNEIGKRTIKQYQREKKWQKFWFHFSLISFGCLLSSITNDWTLLPFFFAFSTITISLDSASTFDNSGAEYNAIARLADDKFVIAFRDVDDQNKGKVIIGTVVGTTITIVADSATTFEAGQTKWVCVCAMSATHFIVAYMDDSDGDKGKMKACSVSGTTITLGAETDFYPSSLGNKNNAICSLDSTYFVIMYQDSGNIYGKVGSLSGTTITLGNQQNLITSNTGNAIDVAKLSSTKIIMGCTYSGAANVKVGTVDTGAKTITAGVTSYMTGSGSSNDFSVECFDEKYFVGVLAYSGGIGKAAIGDVEGTTITFGSSATFNTGSTANIDVCVMDSTHFIVCYQDVGNSNKGTVRGGSISGTTITYDADGEIVFESGNTNHLSIAMLVSNYFVMAFKDNG